MTVKTKRWNDPREPEDGFRLLVCRYRTRGVRKEDETWDAWDRNLGPSPELHAEFYGKQAPPIYWDTYRQRYLSEMQTQVSRIAELARRVAAGQTITLLCSNACKDASQCHRTLLEQLIEEASGM